MGVRAAEPGHFHSRLAGWRGQGFRLGCGQVELQTGQALRMKCWVPSLPPSSPKLTDGETEVLLTEDFPAASTTSSYPSPGLAPSSPEVPWWPWSLPQGAQSLATWFYGLSHFLPPLINFSDSRCVSPVRGVGCWSQVSPCWCLGPIAGQLWDRISGLGTAYPPGGALGVIGRTHARDRHSWCSFAHVLFTEHLLCAVL